MKVLVNAISAKRGGIVTYTRNLMRSLRRRGVDATFAVPPEFPDADAPEALIFNEGALDPFRRLVWEQTVWRSTVARMAPDLLFSSANFGLLTSPVPQLLLVREGGLFDSQYLADIAPSLGIKAAALRALRRRLMLLSARRADRVMTPTEATRQNLLSWGPDLADKSESNLYGTLTDAFTGDHARPWRQDGVLRVLFVSVYYPHKLPGILCEAVARLCEAGLPTHATITMVLDEVRDFPGGAHDAHLIEKAVARGQVTLGRTPYQELPSLYNSHDVFVFPAIAETFGHPLAEALSSGMPVVAADAPVNAEVAGDAALYFPPFSAGQLAERLRELDADAGRCAALVTAARRRAVDLYPWENHVGRLLAIFEKTIATRRGSR